MKAEIVNLREYYDLLLNKKLPDTDIENDELADFYSELVKVDAYYAGVIKTAIDKGNINLKEVNFKHINKLRKRFDAIEISVLKDRDCEIYRECMLYLEFLEKMIYCSY